MHATFAVSFKNRPSFLRGIISVYEIFSRSEVISAGCQSLVLNLKSGCQHAERTFDAPSFRERGKESVCGRCQLLRLYSGGGR